MNVLHTPRLSVPKRVAANVAFDVRCMVAHPQETGYRHDESAALIPRNIVQRFECRVDDVLAFSADLHPGITANPYIAFQLRLAASATVTVMWRDDLGNQVQSIAQVEVHT